MNLSLCLIILFSFSVTSGLPSKHTRHTRAIGGDNAAVGQFPFVVSISLSGSGRHICGGSIIDEKSVVTAAQCVFGYSPNDLTVLAGTNLLDTGGISYKVRGFFVHWGYTKHTYYFHDIAVVIIDGTFEFNNLVNKTYISPGIADYELFTLIGWGDNSVFGYRNELQYTKVTHITDEDCDKLQQLRNMFYPRRPGQFCASSFKGVTACKGDLGGPLLDEDGRLVGIVSYSVSSCESGIPYVYTYVSYYKDWILYSTKKYIS